MSTTKKRNIIIKFILAISLIISFVVCSSEKSPSLELYSYKGRFGYLNKNGEVVIPPQFDKAASFSEGLALVEKNGKFFYIDKNGVFVKDSY